MFAFAKHNNKYNMDRLTSFRSSRTYYSEVQLLAFVIYKKSLPRTAFDFYLFAYGRGLTTLISRCQRNINASLFQTHVFIVNLCLRWSDIYM